MKTMRCCVGMVLTLVIIQCCAASKVPTRTRAQELETAIRDMISLHGGQVAKFLRLSFHDVGQNVTPVNEREGFASKSGANGTETDFLPQDGSVPGGGKACMTIPSSLESLDPDNKGLVDPDNGGAPMQPLVLLQPIFTTFSDISKADIIQATGTVAIQIAVENANNGVDLNIFPLFGRVDCVQGTDDVMNGRLPAGELFKNTGLCEGLNADHGPSQMPPFTCNGEAQNGNCGLTCWQDHMEHMTSYFARLSLYPETKADQGKFNEAIVALMGGGHSLGGVHFENSGFFTGHWTTLPNNFDTEYFSLMHDHIWNFPDQGNGKHLGRTGTQATEESPGSNSVPTGQTIALIPDATLAFFAGSSMTSSPVNNPAVDTKSLLSRFKNNVTDFYETFEKYYMQMTESGQGDQLHPALCAREIDAAPGIKIFFVVENRRSRVTLQIEIDTAVTEFAGSDTKWIGLGVNTDTTVKKMAGSDVLLSLPGKANEAERFVDVVLNHQAASPSFTGNLDRTSDTRGFHREFADGKVTFRYQRDLVRTTKMPGGVDVDPLTNIQIVWAIGIDNGANYDASIGNGISHKHSTLIGVPFFSKLGKCVCDADEDCDDGISCTVDTCNTVDSECVSTPDHDFCDGTFCTPEICSIEHRGCRPGTLPCTMGRNCTHEFTCVDTNSLVNPPQGNCADVAIPTGCDDEVDCTVDNCGGTHCVNQKNNANCHAGHICDPDVGYEVDCFAPPFEWNFRNPQLPQNAGYLTKKVLVGDVARWKWSNVMFSEGVHDVFETFEENIQDDCELTMVPEVLGEIYQAIIPNLPTTSHVSIPYANDEDVGDHYYSCNNQWPRHCSNAGSAQGGNFDQVGNLKAHVKVLPIGDCDGKSPNDVCNTGNACMHPNGNCEETENFVDGSNVDHELGCAAVSKCNGTHPACTSLGCKECRFDGHCGVGGGWMNAQCINNICHCKFTDPPTPCGGRDCSHCPDSTPGTGAGDPIIYGFDGGWFHFMGIHNLVFNLISDRHFMLNSRFFEDEYAPKDMTWMGDLGMRIGTDSLVYTLKNVKILNGKVLQAPQIVKLKDGGKITVWDDAMALEIPNYELYMTVKQNPAHMNVHADYIHDRSDIPHGILGQTADGRKRLQDPEDPAILENWLLHGALVCYGLQGRGCVEGEMEDYIIEGNKVLNTDFTFSKFTSAAVPFTPKSEGPFKHTLPHEFKDHLYKEMLDFDNQARAQALKEKGDSKSRGGAGSNEARYIEEDFFSV